MKKNIFAAALGTILAISALTACGGSQTAAGLFRTGSIELFHHRRNTAENYSGQFLILELHSGLQMSA